MYFQHAKAVWAAFPRLVAGVLLVENVDTKADVGEQAEALFARARELLGKGTESDLSQIQAWRRAFAQMGYKPTQYRSAAEALLRRFRKENTLPTLHPLVDLCNAVSLAYALPIAVIDLDAVDGFLEVRPANGNEVYRSWSGEIEHPDIGEIIFVDQASHVHARRWTFRQSRQSTVSAATTRALVVSEGLHATASTDIPALLDTLSTQLQVAGFQVSQQMILSANTPRWG